RWLGGRASCDLRALRDQDRAARPAGEQLEPDPGAPHDRVQRPGHRAAGLRRPDLGARLRNLAAALPAGLFARQAWGEVDCVPVELFTLASGGGMTATVSTYGGVVQSLCVPSSFGGSVNVALGHARVEEYATDFCSAGASFFGAIIGRYANR